MTKAIKLFAAFLLVAVMSNVTLAQHPDNIRATYTLRAANKTPNPQIVNTVEFDVLMKWTNYPGSGATNEVPDYEYAGGQYFFDCDSAIRGGGVVTMQNAGSDLPTNMQPRNPTVFFDATTGRLQLRWAVNTFPGPGNGYQMPGGNVERKIMRVRLLTTLPEFPQVPLNLIWRNALPNPFTKIFQYSLSNPNPNQEISTPQTHTIDINNDPLPVELASFTATTNRNNVSLAWSTSREINNQGFDVERSVVGSNTWTKAGTVTGNGTTTETKTYSFNDRVGTGNYSYRLKQIDFNGNFEYHNLNSEVNVGVPSDFAMSQNYPNPFNPSTKIDYDIPVDGNVGIILYDMSGREVAKLVNEFKSAGYYTVNFNASNLSSGMYFYRLNAANFTATKKMVLVK